MPVLVLPPSLCQACGAPRELEVCGRTVAEALLGAGASYPLLGRHLFDEAGELRRHLTLFRNDSDVRGQGGLAAPVSDGDVLTLLPPVAGGTGGPGAPCRGPGLPASLDLGPILEHAERAYPEEACGLVFAPEGAGGAGGAPRVVAVPNASPRPRHRFEMAPAVLLAELAVARARGERLSLIYHSHADGPALLSEEDRRAALAPDGSPLWPGVGWLVVSVRGGRAAEARLSTVDC